MSSHELPLCGSEQALGYVILIQTGQGMHTHSVLLCPFPIIANGRLDAEPPIILILQQSAYWHTPSDAQASTKAVWKLATSDGFARNNPKAVSILLFHASLATTPWVRLPTTVSVLQSAAADCKYSLNRD